MRWTAHLNPDARHTDPVGPRGRAAWLGLVVGLVVMLAASAGGIKLWQQQRELITLNACRQAKLSSRGLAVLALPEADERQFLVHPGVLSRVEDLRAVLTYTLSPTSVSRTQIVTPKGVDTLNPRDAHAIDQFVEGLSLGKAGSPWPKKATLMDLPSSGQELVAVSRLESDLSGCDGVLVAVIDDTQLRGSLADANVAMALAAVPAAIISLATGLVAWRFQLRRVRTLARFSRVTSGLSRQRRQLRETVTQLSVTRQRLDLIISGTRDGTWERDLSTDALVMSHRMLELMGYAREDLAPTWMAFFTRAHRDDARGLIAAMQAHIETGATLDVEVRLADPTGELRWFRMRGHAARDAQGHATRLAGSLTDINAQRQAEARMSVYAEELWNSQKALEARAEQLRAAQAASEAANRTKSEFLANMSHEIRTPMTAILGYADLLLDARQTPMERVECVHTIRRSGQHLLTLINDILDLSKIEAGKMTIELIPTSPVALLDEALALVQSQAAAKGITLGFEALNPLPRSIQTDPTRLRQVITNLLSNAVKFTSAGGVRVLASFGPDATLRVEVHDTGIGIEPAQIAHLFQPFHQADGSMTRRFGGTGLGLCISASIVKLLGGTLSVTSTPGEGSCFVVSVPVAQSSTEPVEIVDDIQAERTRLRVALTTQPPESATRCVIHGANVLLAEDGPDNQRLISTLLRRAGARVTIVENGQLAFEAATLASAANEPFDVVLMDMQMPVLDGYAATAKLRAAGWQRPVIALTAHALQEDRDRCLRCGCDDYATKPISRDSLIALVAHWRSRVPKPAQAPSFETPAA